VKNLSGAAAIAAGAQHSLALKNDGTVWAWGANSYGQLGDGTATHRKYPVQTLMGGAVAITAGNFHSLAAKSDGTAWAWGDNSCGQLGDGTATHRSGPVQVAGLNLKPKTAAGAKPEPNRGEWFISILLGWKKDWR
jgi:alpha-tubulin suppressor-like RCC1 family protein